MDEEKSEIPTTIRMPVKLHAKVKALAEVERRSLNAQFLILLEEALKARARNG